MIMSENISMFFLFKNDLKSGRLYKKIVIKVSLYVFQIFLKHPLYVS